MQSSESRNSALCLVWSLQRERHSPELTIGGEQRISEYCIAIPPPQVEVGALRFPVLYKWPWKGRE